MRTITRKEIKRKLAKHYSGDVEHSLKHREVKKTEFLGGGASPHAVVFCLSGTPPKGYAIVIPELREINLYDHKGKRFRILKETVLEGGETDEE